MSRQKFFIDKEQFENYILRGYSRNDISKELGVSGTTLSKVKKDLNITTQYVTKVKHFSKELIASYIQRGYSRHKTALELNCDVTTLQKFCDLYNIHFLRREKDPTIKDMRRAALNSYRVGAHSRGLEFSLSESYFYELVVKPCTYCGDNTLKNVKEIKSYTRSAKQPFRYTGVDRIDSNKGYTIENSISCCFICNRAKREMDEKLFREWVANLVKFYNQC